MKNSIPNLIVSGDFNICHTEIDIHNPKVNKNSSGFLPEEREWLSQFIASGFVDSFRQLNADPHHYSWWSYRAKDPMKSNRGRRLDHIWVTPNLRDNITDAKFLVDFRVKERPSDHIPIILEMAVEN